MNRTALASLGMLGIAAVAGGGYAWALKEGNVELREAVYQFRKFLGPNGSLAYASSSVHPFSRSADLSQVVLRLSSGDLLTADGVTISSEGANRISSVHATGLRVSGDAEDGVGTVGTIDAKDIVLPPRAAGDKVDPAALRVANLALHDLSLHGPGYSFTLRSFEIRDYGPGRPTSLTATTFSTAVPSVQNIDRMGFASASLSGIDLASAVNAMEHDLKPPAPDTGQGKLEIDGAYASNDRRQVVFVRQMRMAGANSADGTTMSSDIGVSGLVINPMDAASRKQLASIGMSRIEGSLDAKATYRLAGGLLDIAPAAEITSLGRLMIDLKIAHLDLSAFTGGEPDMTAILALATQTQFISASAEFTDKGLLNHALAIGSQQTGLAPQQLREQAVAQISQDSSLSAIPDGEQIRAALSSFIQTAGSLGVTVQPPAPLNVLELGQALEAEPMTTLAQLGVAVTYRTKPTITTGD